MKKFITFEGVDGAGKSLLLKLLTDYFDSNNIDYVIAREPGGSKVSEELRNILKDNKKQMCLRTEILLFSASRAELVETFIKPNLNAGKIVLCDRFYDSTRVYQGYANGISDKQIMDITSFATDGIEPDITFLLDIDPKVSLSRREKDSNDRFEVRDMSYHNMVRDGYLKLAKKEKHFCVLDASKTPEQILQKVLEKLKKEEVIWWTI